MHHKLSAVGLLILMRLIPNNLGENDVYEHQTIEFELKLLNKYHAFNPHPPPSSTTHLPRPSLPSPWGSNSIVSTRIAAQANNFLQS